MSVSFEPKNICFIDSVIYDLTFFEKLKKNAVIFFYPAVGIPTIPWLL